MAFVGGMGQGRSPMRMDGERGISKYTDEEICGCLPKKQAKKKKSKTHLLKERIRQFSIWYFENEDQKENEHVKIRRGRKNKQKHIDTLAWMRALKFLYILDGLVWIVGSVLTFCSTVEEIGKNTPFYKQRHIYEIIGPLVLFLGVILLLLATGMKHRIMISVKQPKNNRFFIKQKKVQNDWVKDETAIEPIIKVKSRI